MPWIYLIIAGILEIGWGEWTQIHERLGAMVADVLTVGCMGWSFWLYTQALKEHWRWGRATGVRVGIGAAGTAESRQ